MQNVKIILTTASHNGFSKCELLKADPCCGSATFVVPQTSVDPPPPLLKVEEETVETVEEEEGEEETVDDDVGVTEAGASVVVSPPPPPPFSQSTFWGQSQTLTLR